MRVDLTRGRTSRATVNPLEFLNQAAVKLLSAAKDRADAKERARIQAALPTAAERREDLVSFYDHYESLVETLCDAAQYGPTPALDRSFEQHATYLRGAYPTLRPFLAAFLRCRDEEIAANDIDPFVALVKSPDLEDFLRSDDGDMIDRITRTREALNLYGEHLRQLVARTA